MRSLPASVPAASLLCLGSAVYGLSSGTLGLEIPGYHVPRALAVVAALVHAYCAFGLFAGSNFARVTTLWLLGISFAVTWIDLWRFVRSEAPVGDFAEAVVKLAATVFFLWQLSGPKALAFFDGGGGHANEHAHAS